MPNPIATDVTITGATGYLGRGLVESLVRRGHPVRAVVRSRSLSRAPAGAEPVVADVFDVSRLAAALRSGSTLVHLIGTPRPAPWKADSFRRVDLGALIAVLDAARRAQVAHLVYVSVAQPAPVMRAYQRIRAECETRIRASGLPATLLRPWYVLGPGHRWPLLLAPLYALAERLPPTATGARRLGLVRFEEMIHALHWSIDHPSDSVRILDVPAIRELSRFSRGALRGVH